MKPEHCRRVGQVAVAAALLLAGLLLAVPTAARGQASAASAYVPCLGCAEHTEIETRWRRPFLTELSGEGFLLFDHFRLETQARSLGLCETDFLMRGPALYGRCHPFSLTRALLIETPIELVAFTSPAWGLERRGHPRWALLVEALPMTYHLLSIRATSDSIQQWNRLQLILH